MERYNLKKEKIMFHNIVIANTSAPDYDMSKWLLLEDLEDLKYNEFVVVEGGHCSCYGFDDTEWEAIKYSKEELLKIVEDRMSKRSYYIEEIKFYELVRDYLVN